MPIRSGSIGYARFRILSAGGATPPADASQGLLDALARHTLRTSEIGEPAPVEFGWCGGRHVFDEEFAAEHNVFGRSLLFGLRIDTNSVPAEIRRAYRSMSERALAMDSSTGLLSRRERQAAREDALERCRQDLASGKYRRSKVAEILWNLERNLVLAPVFSDANVAGLRDLFFATFDLRLEPVTSGSLARDLLEARGRLRDYEDMQPSRITAPPPGFGDGESAGSSPDRARPTVPWAHGATDANDFIGNEFLLWLWRRSDAAALDNSAARDRDDPHDHIACILDRSLEMECAWDTTGRISLQNGVMTRAPEAIRGLQIGKWPRKAGLMVAASDESWQATLQGDRFNISGARIEPPKDNPKSQRELIEHRLESLLRFDSTLLALFESFLATRASRNWAAETRRMIDWVAGRSRTEHPAIEVKVHSGSGLVEAAT